VHDWLDLLPIESLEPLLAGLAARWRETLGAERVVVSSLSSERTALVAGWADLEGHGAERWELPVAVATWTDALVVPLIGEYPRLARIEDTWSRGLGPEAGPLAGVHVQGDPPSEALLATLVKPTQRLLTQGRLVDRLVHDALAEKLEAMAEFAAGAGHEINNPLATINGRVQLLLKDETDPERRRSLTVIGGQAYRVRDMIGDAMLFARPPVPQPTLVDAAAVVRRVGETLREDFDETSPQLVVAADEPVTVFADEMQLAIVVTELVRNALHAAGDSGRVTVAVSGREGRNGLPPHGEIVVTDDGPGLTDLDRRHLFDPFYSGRQAGRGLGFGLSKAWRIVRLHGGRIDVDSTAGATAARVTWPAPRREM
jgi:signal transduction histidine kinase